MRPDAEYGPDCCQRGSSGWFRPFHPACSREATSRTCRCSGTIPRAITAGARPFEAASMGIPLAESETAFRCNLVTIENETMIDYSAGHITTGEAQRIISDLQQTPHDGFDSFLSGRQLPPPDDLPGFSGRNPCTPPHDITGKPIQSHLPQGNGSELLLSLMQQARALLPESAVNKERRAQGKSPVTDIWLWGQGRSLSLPTISQRYGISRIGDFRGRSRSRPGRARRTKDPIGRRGNRISRHQLCRENCRRPRRA